MHEKNALTTKSVLSKIIFVFLIALLGFFSYSLLREVKRKQAIQDEIKYLEQELIRLEPDNQQLSTLIEYLQTDEYAELEAKKRLGMKKQNEQVILVTEDKEIDLQQIILAQDQRSNWEIWWQHFFN